VIRVEEFFCSLGKRRYSKMTKRILGRLNGDLAPWTQRLLLAIVLGFSGWLVSQVEKINDFPVQYVRAAEFHEYQRKVDQKFRDALVEQRKSIQDLKDSMDTGFAEIRRYIYDLYSREER
jgi:hypothetical protein